MGLDMYLSKKSYVKQWSHKKPEDQFEVNVTKGNRPFPNIKPERVSYVTEELMYWRKANQIHGWFCANGSEEITEVKYRLTKTDLEVLMETCKTVLDIINNSPKKTIQVVGGWKDGGQYMVDVEVYENEDVIKDLLPPTEGFFYGGYEIDEWYKQTIEETLNFLQEELPNCEEDEEFEYYASW
jgi:hypothetical protein